MLQDFRIFNGISNDAYGDPVNNYNVSKHVAKKSALIALGYIISVDNSEYWIKVKEELVKIKF